MLFSKYYELFTKELLVSKRLQALIEQTQFLLDRQTEAKDACGKAFESLLGLIDKKLKGCEASQAKRLERVHELLSGQAEQLMEDTEGDIDFLKTQLDSLVKISKVSDANKANEMLGMLIDPSEEVFSTEEFKKGVMDELAASQEGFNVVIEDISAALEEGDIANVEVMLEQLASSGDEDMDDEDECDEEEDGCGSACSAGGCGDCSGGCGVSDDKGVDIFSSLSAYDRELAKDKNSTDHH